MIVTKKSTPHFAKTESGGKGHNLYVLTQAGLKVPDWTVIGKSYFEEFVTASELGPQIQFLTLQFETGQISADVCESKILELFNQAPLQKSLEQAVEESLALIGPEHLVSVRSSAADEDSISHSFAGQLSSYLYVQGTLDICRYVRLCWASAYSARGLSYRKENKISFAQIKVAVVIQRMIDPDKSGVLFTADPVEQNVSTYVISSVYGVGEGLVSGALDADSFWLDAETGSVKKQEIVPKNQMMKKSGSGESQLVETPQSLILAPSLSAGNIHDLYQAGKTIHCHYHRPQDIEWAIFENQVWVLQARPITNLEKDLQGYPNLWDNSNIVESYGGLTSPLSFSFALRNYKAVYVQFCEVLGVPTEIIKDMDSYLAYMLGSIRGRVYYNLFNWYKLVGVLPGFQLNREFMETMMGVSEALTTEINDRIKPHPSWDTLSGRVRKFVTGLNFLKYHFTIQSVVDDFLKTFKKDYDHYRSLPLNRMRGDELIRVYFDIERNMLGRWKAPIINDFLCMVHFGLLRKLTTTWLKDLDPTLQNNLLAGEGGLESAEPTKALLRLATKAQQDPELSELIMSTSPGCGLERINQSKFQDFYKDILEYLDLFGFRCMSEMKLEEIDLNTDPSYLFVVLQNYLRSGKVAHHDDAHEKELRNRAELAAKGHLSFFKQLIYFWVLKNARKAVKNRENTRFSRTRIYGIARAIFRYIGEDLGSLGILPHPRDVFWLTIEEVFGVYNGTLPSPDLVSIVNVRKNSYTDFGPEEPDPRILSRGAVYWKNVFFSEIQMATDLGGLDGDLKGLPCCPGEIEGIVKVIMNPSDDLSLNKEILVTARTDPGWVPLYPSISGLLVERGSLLSHSAIVAREMGIPAIVSIPGLTKTLKTGMRIRMNGKTGMIKIISS